MADFVTRFGVSLPNSLVEKFDKAIDELGYENRSKAIMDSIEEFLIAKKPQHSGELIGTISYLYNHHVSDVNRKLVDLQHGFEGTITSTMHAHITHNECVEVLIVSGESDEIHRLYGGISSLRGVKTCEFSVLNVKD